MPRFNLGFNQRNFNGTVPTSTAAINIGAMSGKGSAPRIFNDCKKSSKDYSGCIQEFLGGSNSPPPFQVTATGYNIDMSTFTLLSVQPKQSTPAAWLVFSENGSFTVNNLPTGSSLTVYAIGGGGGGGGGGGAKVRSGKGGGSGGGGGGGYYLTGTITSNGSYNVVVGSGGQGGQGGGGASNDGDGTSGTNGTASYITNSNGSYIINAGEGYGGGFGNGGGNEGSGEQSGGAGNGGGQNVPSGGTQSSSGGYGSYSDTYSIGKGGSAGGNGTTFNFTVGYYSCNCYFGGGGGGGSNGQNPCPGPFYGGQPQTTVKASSNWCGLGGVNIDNNSAYGDPWGNVGAYQLNPGSIGSSYSIYAGGGGGGGGGISRTNGFAEGGISSEGNGGTGANGVVIVLWNFN